MDTEYAEQINSRPVIYFTLKDFNAQTPEELAAMLCKALASEYERFYSAAKVKSDEVKGFLYFEKLYGKILDRSATLIELAESVSLLEEIAFEIYHKQVILLWDEYDTPIMRFSEISIFSVIAIGKKRLTLYNVTGYDKENNIIE